MATAYGGIHITLVWVVVLDAPVFVSRLLYTLFDSCYTDESEVKQMYRGTFAMIDLHAFSNNVNYIHSRLRKGTKLLLAVKADAYGHGIRPMIKTIRNLPVAQVAVATLEEALTIRDMDETLPVLILGALGPQELVEAASRGIHVLYTSTWGVLDELPHFSPNRPLHVHIPFDTGMNRLGLKSAEEAIDIVRWMTTRDDVVWSGVCSHLACSDASDSAHAHAQVAQLRARLDALVDAGFTLPPVHVSNSGGALRDVDWHFDMVRVGIAAFGYSPDDQVLPSPSLQPVMHVYSQVTRVADVSAGETIGYGATFTAQKPMRVATVSIGYADGYPRLLSNRGILSVHGHDVPVVGRVCMDQIMVDVTDVPDVQVGDFITVFGRRAPLSWTNTNWLHMPANQREAWLKETYLADDNRELSGVSLWRFSTLAETIPYEITCQMNARVPRIYVGEAL